MIVHCDTGANWVAEFPPDHHLINYKGHYYRLPFPYIIAQVHLFNRKPWRLNMSVRTKPISPKRWGRRVWRVNTYHLALPNVHATGSVCMGDGAGYYLGATPEDAINRFWLSRFNDDIGIGRLPSGLRYLRPMGIRIILATWQRASTEDVLKWKWEPEGRLALE